VAREGRAVVREGRLLICRRHFADPKNPHPGPLPEYMERGKYDTLAERLRGPANPTTDATQ
jgi:hypothetical protein